MRAANAGAGDRSAPDIGTQRASCGLRGSACLLLAVAVNFATPTPARAAETLRSVEAGNGLVAELVGQSSRSFNANYGFVKSTSVSARITFNGKPVQTAAGDALRPWDAWVIRSRAGAAVLAASRDAWLITLSGGLPQVNELAGSGADFASFQILDGPDGQPGERIEVYQRSDTAGNGELPADRLLLINGVTVLDTATLQWRNWQLRSPENRDRAGGFNATGGKALLLSPRKQRVALWARGSDDSRRLGLVVVDLLSGRVTQTVPVDRQLTHIGKLEYYVNPAWAARYFEWTQSGSDERLALRRNAAAIPRRGWHLTSGNEFDHEYRLPDVEVRMVDSLLNVATREFGMVASDDVTDGVTRLVQLSLGSRTFTLRWSRIESANEFGELSVAVDQKRRRALQAGEETHAALIARLARRFDEELAAGQHQGLFQKH